MQPSKEELLAELQAAIAALPEQEQEQAIDAVADETQLRFLEWCREQMSAPVQEEFDALCERAALPEATESMLDAVIEFTEKYVAGGEEKLAELAVEVGFELLEELKGNA